jgi:polyphosphate kinase
MKSKETDPILDGSNEDEDFFNRELSWLAFNERVLSLAEDDEKPLGERIRFLAISADNLNEFFMVRVAGLRQLVDRGFKRLPEDDVDSRSIAGKDHVAKCRIDGAPKPGFARTDWLSSR